MSAQTFAGRIVCPLLAICHMGEDRLCMQDFFTMKSLVMKVFTAFLLFFINLFGAWQI